MILPDEIWLKILLFTPNIFMYERILKETSKSLYRAIYFKDVLYTGWLDFEKNEKTSIMKTKF
jgi:hypothetical protein